MAGSVVFLYLPPTLWDTPTEVKDMTPYGYITVWCFQAPTTPYTIMCGVDPYFIPQLVNCNDGIESIDVAQITSVGRYVLPANCQFYLAGGTGGIFFISGGA